MLKRRYRSAKQVDGVIDIEHLRSVQSVFNETKPRFLWPDVSFGGRQGNAPSTNSAFHSRKCGRGWVEPDGGLHLLAVP